MNILFNQPMSSIWEKHLDPHIDQWGKAGHRLWLGDEEDYPGIGAMEVILGGKPDSEMVEAARLLKLIIVPFAGINHLPLELLARRGVRVANSHGNASFVAERALALILAWYGRVVEFHNDLAAGKWHGFWVGRGVDDTWRSIRGTTCTIFGTGQIGTHLASLLAPFDVEVTGVRRRTGEVPPGFSGIHSDPDEAIAGADTVVITLPATEATRGLFNRERLSRMKGKLLVNVGRGSLVDEDALHEALHSGDLGGAAIDCWYNYPKEGVQGFPSDYPIHELHNVVLSPHIAGFTPAAAEENLRQACENLRLFLQEGRLLFEVDVAGGY